LVKVNRQNPDLESIKAAIRRSFLELSTDKIFRSVIVFADVDPS